MSEQQMGRHTPVKMYRTSDRLGVAAPMPGLLPEDLQVEVTQGNGVLVVVLPIADRTSPARARAAQPS